MHPPHLQALKGMPEFDNRSSDLQGCALEVKKSVPQAAPRAFICAQRRGVSNPTRFKTIVEASKVSPKAGLYKDSRSAKFLHWKFSLKQPG